MHTSSVRRSSLSDDSRAQEAHLVLVTTVGCGFDVHQLWLAVRCVHAPRNGSPAASTFLRRGVLLSRLACCLCEGKGGDHAN